MRGGGGDGDKKRRGVSNRDQDDLKRKWEGMTGIPAQYVAMAGDIRAEVAKSDHRPLKRRKRPGEKVEVPEVKVETIVISDEATPVVESESESESESDDEEQWEAVDLNGEAEDDDDEQVEDTHITVELHPGDEKPEKKKKRVVQKLSKEERERRVVVHKIQLMALFHHAYIRNKWCSSFTLRNAYKDTLTEKVRNELHPPGHLSDTLKTRKFLDGLRHASVFWRKKFRITSNGSRMIGWNEIYDNSRVIETATSFSAFHRRLMSFRGSRDLAAQGFCALLRAQDLEARLVCSLQPLDFTSNVPVTDTPPSLSPESKYPVYWVEAWDQYSSRWVSVDPAVSDYMDVIRVSTNSKLEPPGTDAANSLRYVVAYSQQLQATDVTRRYTQNYRTKVRKKRITSTDDGFEWWQKVLQKYSPPRELWSLREIDEEMELNRRETNEGLPTNVQDFKNHPTYVLDRHLRKDEVLLSREICGTFSIGKGTKAKLENIYNRKHVRQVKSAQRWFRDGRIVKESEQPLSYAKRTKSKHELEHDNEDENGSALYSIDQTEVYVPDPIIDGRVPKNGFGNIDIYTASMVPQGGVHIPEPQVNVAARLIGVDYADAVTGFVWNNKKMNPKVEGIVVACEYEEAVREVYAYLLEEQRQMEDEELRKRALGMWRRYLIALRIEDRLNKTHGHIEREGEPVESSKGSSDEGGFIGGSRQHTSSYNDDEDEGGGFFGGAPAGESDDDDDDGGFITGAPAGESDDDDGGFITGAPAPIDESDDDGGFVINVKQVEEPITEDTQVDLNPLPFNEETQIDPVPELDLYEETVDSAGPETQKSDLSRVTLVSSLPRIDYGSDDDRTVSMRIPQFLRPRVRGRKEDSTASTSTVLPKESKSEEIKPKAKAKATEVDKDKGSGSEKSVDMFPDSVSESELLGDDDEYDL